MQKPKTCLLTVSNTCHMKCMMCDLWKHATAHEELTSDECMRFITECNAWVGSPLEFHLIGGETFIKPGIFDIIRHARSLGSRVVVTSSAYSITPSVAREIAHSDLSMLNISLESLDPAIHDRMRGAQGVQARAREAIELVSAAAPHMELAINTIIAKPNMHGVKALAEWVQSQKRLSHIYFMAVMRPFGSDLDVTWFREERGKELWPDESIEAVLDDLIILKKQGVRIGNSIPQLEVFKQYFKDPLSGIIHEGCRIDTHALNVNALGDVYFCFFMEKLGNIKQDTPERIWNAPQAERIRERMRTCRRNCEAIVNCYFDVQS